jgi:PII-like signaling protein
MASTDEMALLRVYTGERARERDHPLYQEIVLRAVEAGLAGATVLRGPLGFGQSRTLQDADLVDSDADLPTIVEIADRESRLRAFLASYPELTNAGLITLERITIAYAHALVMEEANRQTAP